MTNYCRSSHHLRQLIAGVGLAGAAAVIGLTAPASHADVADINGWTLQPDGSEFYPLIDPSTLVAGEFTSVPASAAAVTSSDLLAEATTNFTDANNVLTGIDPSGVPGVNSELFSIFLNSSGVVHDAASQQISALESSETVISSYGGGEFASLATPIFTDVNQGWLQGSEAVLAADQALQAAVSTETGVEAAQFAALLADGRLIIDVLHSGSIDFVASLLSL